MFSICCLAYSWKSLSSMTLIFYSWFLEYDASLPFYPVFSLPGAFQFSLMRKGWYICRSIHKNYHRMKIVTDYNMGAIDWLKRCSFALRPLAVKENPLMNCFGTFKPPKPPVTMATSSPAITTTPTTRPTTATTPRKPEGKFTHFRNRLNWSQTR